MAAADWDIAGIVIGCVVFALAISIGAGILDKTIRMVSNAVLLKLLAANNTPPPIILSQIKAKDERTVLVGLLRTLAVLEICFAVGFVFSALLVLVSVEFATTAHPFIYSYALFPILTFGEAFAQAVVVLAGLDRILGDRINVLRLRVPVALVFFFLCVPFAFHLR